MRLRGADILCIVVLVTAVGYSSADSTTTTSPSPTPTPTTTTTTTSPSPTPTPTTTTTTTSPSPTPTPTPTPTPALITYNVPDDKDANRTCILMKARISVTMNYTVKDQAKWPTEQRTFDLSNETLARVDEEQSHCSEHAHDAHMTIVWNSSDNHTQSLTFVFKRQTYYLWKISEIRQNVTVTAADFPNVNLTANTTETLQFHIEEALFQTEFQRSYECNPTTHYSLTNLTNTTLINETTLSLSDWRIQVFEFKDDGKFGNARECAAQAGKNIKVPIAVGAALAVLVSVVVVVYILSRLRKRRLTSYQSLN